GSRRRVDSPQGRAASDNTPLSSPPAPAVGEFLAPRELQGRLDEELARAERYATPLSCLLLVVDNLEELEQEHGGGLREQTLSYIAGALPRELRRCDRVGKLSDGELLVLLPGADGASGEMVARRVLERMRTIKVEVDG